MVQNPCVHQLRLVVSPIIYSFFYIPSGFLARFLPTTGWFSKSLLESFGSQTSVFHEFTPLRQASIHVGLQHSTLLHPGHGKGQKKTRGFWGFFGVMFCPQTWESKAISQVFVPWKNPSEGSFYSPPLSWKKGLVSRGVAVRNLRFPCNVLLKHKDYCWVWQKTIMAEEHGEATSFRCCVVLSQQKILQRLAFSDFSSYVFLISPYNGWRQKLQPRFPKGLNGCLLRVLCLFEVI